MVVPLLLALAVVQAICQSIFFLNVLSETGPRWNLLIFISTLSIMLIIIIGAIWIMQHLDANMMPHHLFMFLPARSLRSQGM